MRKGRVAVVAGMLAVVAVLIWWIGHKGGGGVHATEAPGARDSKQPAKADTPVAPAHASLGGKVTDDKGKPIEGAIVRIAPREGDETAARTAKDGTYGFDDVAPGKLTASASAVGFLAKDGGAIALAPGEQRTLDFTLAPGGHSLAGSVTDATGGSIAGVLIEASRERGVLAGTTPDIAAAYTDDQGHYTMTVADGAYRVSASHAEYVGATKRTDVTPSGATVDFALVPGGVIEGTVEDATTGQGVAGAHVDVEREVMSGGPGGEGARGRGLASTITDGTGHFRVSGLEPGAIAIRARAPGRVSLEPTVVPLGVAESVTGVIVVVQRAPSISGTIVDEDGKPAPEATAYLMGEMSIENAEADANGAFVFEGVKPGSYQLAAGGHDYLDSKALVPVTVEKTPVTGVKLVVERGAMIRGRVDPAQVADVEIPRDPTEAAGGGLDLRALTQDRVATEAGPDGTFVLGPVDPGTTEVAARAADGRRGKVSVDVTPKGADGVVIHLADGATLMGRVTDGKGPVAGAIVSVRRVKAHARTEVIVNGIELTAERAPTGADGRYQIMGLDAGDYELQVIDERGAPYGWRAPADKTRPAAPVKVTLAAADRKTQDLEIERPHGVIKGVVMGPDGKPLADAWVSASRGFEDMMGRHDSPDDEDVSRMMVVRSDGGDDDLGIFGGVPPVLTGPDGRFELAHLRRGTYEVTAEGVKGMARGSKSGVEPDADITITLASLTELSGSVVANGAPVGDFTVELSGTARREQRFLAADGHFTMQRIDPGTYDVEVSAKEGTGHASVTVVAGQKADVQVTLVGHGRITGKVVDEAGKPIAGAPVVSVPNQGNGMVSVSISGPPKTTGDDGSFAIDSEPGARYLVVLGGSGPVVMKALDVKSGDTIDLGTLTAEKHPHRPH